MKNLNNTNTDKDNEYYDINNDYSDELIFSDILQKEEYYLNDDEELVIKLI